MSQIATAYVIAPDYLETLAKLAGEGQYQRFWELLRQNGKAVEPAYGYSGYVVAVLSAYLEEAGISLPLGEEHPAISDMLEGDVSLLMAVSGERAQDSLEELDQSPLDTAKLATYFEEFTGEVRPEAGTAMLAAMEFLRSGLHQVSGRPEWLLVFVG